MEANQPHADAAGAGAGAGAEQVDTIDIDLFVIGAMKAATTSMCDWLGAQPGVAMSSPKEPGIFNSDADVEAWLPRTATLFSHVDAPRVRVEGSTFYTKFPDIPGVPRRLHQHCPEARFVYLMRHPVERLLSQYRFDWLRGVNDLSLSESLERLPQLVDNGRYAFQLSQWLEVFPPDRFLLVFAEQFTADPESQVSRILDFVGAGPGTPVQAPQQGHANRTDDIMRSTVARRLLRKSSFGRAVRPFVPTQLVKKYHDRARSKPMPELSDAERQSVVDTYDEDLASLTQMTSGPGLSCQSWHQVVTSWTPELSAR